MPVTYEPWVVLLSIVIAIQGAYVGLSLAVQIGEAAGVRRRLLLAGAAFSLAVAIWAMHFVGMLAVRLPFPVDYLVFPTLLSFLVCVIVVGAAVFATSSGPLTWLRLTLSASLMGAGIFTMHYLGMSALHASAHMISCVGLRGGEPGGCHCGIGTGLLARGRSRRPPAINPVGDGLRRGGFRDALHCDGRRHALPTRGRNIGSTRAFNRSPCDRCRGCRVLRFRHFPACSCRTARDRYRPRILPRAICRSVRPSSSPSRHSRLCRRTTNLVLRRNWVVEPMRRSEAPESRHLPE